MALKATVVKNAKPRDKKYIIRDDNLAMYVYPTGKKVWYCVCKVDGKPKQENLGNYPAISLREAIAKKDDFILARDRGELDKPKTTLAGLAADYISKHKKDYTDSGKEYTRIFDVDVNPIIGHRFVDEVTKSDVYSVVSKITERGSPRQANITLEKISVVLKWGCSIGLLETNVCQYMSKNKAADPRQVTLNDDQITHLLSQDSSTTWGIFQFMLYTGCRGGEAKEYPKTIVGDWWLYKQNKGKKTIKNTFLTQEARQIMERMPHLSKSTGIANFARRGNFGYTPHDIRRTVSSRLAEHFPYEHVDKLLGHSLPRIKATYNVYSYKKEIQEMLVWWAGYLQSIISK